MPAAGTLEKMQSRFRLIIAAALAGSGCSLQLAPPARAAIGSIPELPSPGAGEVRVSGGGVGTDFWDGELGARVALTEQLGLDAAALAYPGEFGGVVMGSVLLRYAPLDDESWARFAVVVGPALGCGAFDVVRRVDDGPGPSCSKTLAGGGLAGVDLGARFHETTALFLGLRYQLTKATEVPWTHWGLGAVGIRFDLAWAYAAVEGGVLVFGNDNASGTVPVWHLTIGAQWPGG